jgi:hypothetical protein
VDQKVTPGEIVVMASAGVALIASFLPFYSNGDDSNAWDEGLFPVATLITLFLLAAGGLVALTKFANVRIDNVLGFGLLQIVLILGFFGALIAVAFLFAERLGFDLGFGYFILLIAGIASVAGTVVMMNERRTTGPI